VKRETAEVRRKKQKFARQMLTLFIDISRLTYGLPHKGTITFKIL